MLDACILELSEKGYSNTSIDDIAVRAGISKMSVYYHFESKDALCVEALTTLMQDFRRELMAALSGRDDTRDALQCATQVVLSHFMTLGGSFYALLGELQRINPGLLEKIEAAISEYSHVVSEVVRAGQRRGDIIAGDISILTQLFISTVGSTVHWYDPSGPIARKELTRILQDVVPRLLLEAPPPTKPARPARSLKRKVAS